MKEYVAYIDEAGDEGFGKLAAGPLGGQSRWLVLGACIVSRENDLKLPLLRDGILSHFPKRKTRDLHFRDLNHAQKIVACQDIAAFRLGVCVTLSHKVTIPGTRFEPIFKKKQYLYNYMVRWLLERLTAVCARAARPSVCTLKLVFSRRSGTNYQVMKDYLVLMRDGLEVIRPVRSINWDVLDVENIAVENHSKWAGLQIADCTTSAYFMALEPNVYGNSEPSYANILKSKLLKDPQGRVLNCGVTPVPSLMNCGANAVQLSFLRSLEKNGQAPGL
jgi:hypothetical protein